MKQSHHHDLELELRLTYLCGTKVSSCRTHRLKLDLSNLYLATLGITCFHQRSSRVLNVQKSLIGGGRVPGS